MLACGGAREAVVGRGRERGREKGCQGRRGGGTEGWSCNAAAFCFFVCCELLLVSVSFFFLFFSYFSFPLIVMPIYALSFPLTLSLSLSCFLWASCVAGIFG